MPLVPRVDDVLGHIAVGFLDAAFTEVPGIAVILVTGTAGHASRVGARAAHGWYDKVSRLEALDSSPHVHDLGHRLVPDHQVVIPRWRSSAVLVIGHERDTWNGEEIFPPAEPLDMPPPATAPTAAAP